MKKKLPLVLCLILAAVVAVHLVSCGERTVSQSAAIEFRIAEK